MAIESAILLGVHIAGFAIWTGCLTGFLILGVTALRLLRACLIAMPVTLASGWLLAFRQFGMPGLWPWAVNAMQTAGLAMAVVLLIAVFGAMMLLGDAEAARDREAIASAARRLIRLAAIDLAFGVLTLGFAVAGYYG